MRIPVRVMMAATINMFLVSALIAQDPHSLIKRAIDATGLENTKGKILHFHAADILMQTAQSDRMYPPYYPQVNNSELWFDAERAVQRTQSSTIFFGRGPTPTMTSIIGQSGGVVLRDTLVFPTGGGPDKMNVWDVLIDWNRTGEVKLEKPSVYRDYSRNIVSRNGRFGKERLFLDPKSGLPVKLEYSELHFLWGQADVEYLYMTWISVGNTLIPSGVVKIVNGEPDTYRTVGKSELVAMTAAPSLEIPPSRMSLPPSQPGVLSSPEPDTVRVSGNTILTRNRFYQEGISFIDGTIYVFDATLGENRAKQDSAWIAKAFPGEHPIVVVVTDLAWPHIAGVRYWVSKGATIVSHRMSEEFLKKVIDRKWTMNPDELEKNRSRVRFKFTPVGRELSLAGGKVKLYAIDGLGSEGGLMAYLPEEKFLWAGDYIQSVRRQTAYAKEVRDAVQRVGIKPERVAAQHIPLTPWSTIDGLFK